MKEPKVTHVIRLNESPMSPPFSGAENHLLFLLPELTRLGVDVELIVIYQSQGPLMKAAFEKLTQAGVVVTLLPLAVKARWHYLGLLALQRTFDLISLLRARRDRIIHLHLDYFGAPLAAWLSKCSCVVMSIHNDEEWLDSFAMRLWFRIMNLMVSRYIAISERVKDYFIHVSGIKPGKIERIYYGVDYKNELSTEKIREKYKFPAGKFVVGFIGRLVYQKNIELLLEAARILSEVHFVIVGDGELRESLKHQADGLQNVQFLGYQPNGHEIMPGFDLFCLPSRFEGLGLVLVEAMQQSVPIVASRAGAIPEILAEGRYGLLFNGGEVDGLVSSIQFAQRNHAEILEMVHLAYEYSKEVFTIEEMGSRTVNLYLNVLGK
ncbi:MAG: glycosyltransferase family 4 protein [Anaerolineales bacterium]|nr:glycosyltransferase family 4 protein [Anaerolineales bacterium]